MLTFPEIRTASDGGLGAAHAGRLEGQVSARVSVQAIEEKTAVPDRTAVIVPEGLP